MAISFENALSIHQYTVSVRSQRAEVLASNLANANTPGFRAQDLNFKRALESAKSSEKIRLNQTDGRHISAFVDFLSGEKMYRIPHQPDTGDGNTVDAQLERNLFMQNTIEYQASLDFLGAKFRNMTKALKGE